MVVAQAGFGESVGHVLKGLYDEFLLADLR
jgi:hypothetical protein